MQPNIAKLSKQLLEQNTLFDDLWLNAFECAFLNMFMI